MRPKITALFVMGMSLLILSGCASNNSRKHSAAPRAYDDAVKNIYLGMEKRDFDNVMRPVNEKTTDNAKRRSEAYQRNGMVYEIVYIRSGWVSDGALTDDEYTPYLFQDSSLIGYGWAAVGSKKTDSADIRRAQAGATKINVEQKNNNNAGNAWTPAYCKSKGGDNPWC